MKKIVSLIVAIFSASVMFAQGDLHLFEVDNKNGFITPDVIEKAFVQNGFKIAVNSEMNLPFKKQFKKTKFKIYNLLTVHHSTLSHDLVRKHPDAGVFTPLGIGIYQGLNEDTLHVSMLTSEAQAKILDFDDSLLKSIEKEVLKTIRSVMPNAKHKFSENSLKESRNLVTKYELDLDGEDWEEMREEIELGLENGFKPVGFVMANYLDFNEELVEGGNSSPFDFYVTYSICKLKVIYTVSQTRPEAAAFAPCTMMVYKKKDEDKVVIGFPGVYNWMSSARVDNKKTQAILQKAQDDFEDILKEVTE
ncbi:DUF302 domain-containing protein [Sulfurimonas sp.]|uniref:DUF302 domain-containing protein n=1 Tax=Sulfurimonas sp. TaxID=2022749 RepID=UPI002B49A919|nr:DUF302 domain-containing protein [Sulfurimonas sp.]